MYIHIHQTLKPSNLETRGKRLQSQRKGLIGQILTQQDSQGVQFSFYKWRELLFGETKGKGAESNAASLMTSFSAGHMGGGFSARNVVRESSTLSSKDGSTLNLKPIPSLLTPQPSTLNLKLNPQPLAPNPLNPNTVH